MCTCLSNKVNYLGLPTQLLKADFTSCWNNLYTQRPYRHKATIQNLIRPMTPNQTSICLWSKQARQGSSEMGKTTTHNI